MRNKHFFLTVIAAAMSLTSASAQDYYDLTEYYLQNPSFTVNVDYDINAAAENVANGTLNTPKGWTLENNSKALQAVVATFQYGTQATFVNKALPATGPDGTTNGSCLTLSASFGNHVTFYQSAKLPAGNYRMLVTYYNCNDASETATSQNGWFVSSSECKLSGKTTFGIGEWRKDTIDFTLEEATSGRLQIGIKCSGATVKNAMLAVDNVQLLRDTPYGDQDNLVPAPTVTTDMRFARGATMAFGRIKKVTGESIAEQGFCWAETPEPTINDNITTEYLTNEGKIYWLKDLKPATLYYMRAYAKNSYGKVGYGDVIKFSTIPKGQITFSIRSSDDASADKRIKAAAQTAIDWWNNLTEMKGFSPSIGYNSGVPTAECSYGGWMSVGSNTSYQRPGTIMHEMLHGCGVIPWADTEWSRHNLRSGVNGDGYGTGQWLGDRVTEVLRFWDNSTTEVLNGDYQHMWPYGINGANEDNGSDVLYIGNGLVCQALGEDGLQHTGSLYAEPYYALTQEDNVKYYLKNEDEERGLYTSFLIPNSTGALKWRAMSAAEAQANDSTAWYITFTPSNQYYQLRNAATGQYMTYSGGIKTMTRSSLTSNDNFHLMKGRVDVGIGTNAKRGYWIIHPTSNWSPTCLQANAGGSTVSKVFNIANSATQQRWLILTAEEMTEVEEASVAAIKTKLNTQLADIKKLVLVPHIENTAGTDQAFNDAIADIEQRVQNATQITQVMTLQDEATAAVFNFLCNVSVTDRSLPFDLTYMVQNAGMDATDGWADTPSLNYSCAEFFEKTFNFYQNIDNLPGGDYQVRVQGFQRPGTYTNAYNDYAAGKNNVNAELYAGSTDNATMLSHIAAAAQSKKVGKGNESTVGSNLYVPNNMEAASAYFAKGLYENAVEAKIDSDGGTLRIGVRSTSQPNGSGYWTIFDNFRLYFFGKTLKQGDVNADGTIDVADIASIITVMAGEIGQAQGAEYKYADVNGDGAVDVADISTVIDIMSKM